MAQEKNYTWRETRPGIWVRDVDEIEQFYSALAKLYEGTGRMFFAITGHLSLRVPVSNDSSVSDTEAKVDEALQKAWLKLRCIYPTIASQTRLDPKTGEFTKEYEAQDNGWAQRTLVSVTSGQTGLEWANSDPPAPKMPTMFIVKPPGQEPNVVLRDLVFRSPHDVLDGIGALHMLGTYAQHTADALSQGDAYPTPDPSDPEVIQRLSPPFRVAARVPSVPTDAMTARINRVVASREESARSTVEMLDMPFKHGEVVPGKHQRVELVLPADKTARLVAACKEAGATVTHVYHAALTMVLRDLQKRSAEPRSVQYVGYILRNERHCCVKPYNGPEHAVSVYHSVSGEKLVVDLTVPSATADNQESKEKVDEEREEFLRIVQTMKNFYHTVKNDVDHYLIAPFIWGMDKPPLPVPLNNDDDSKPLSIPPPKRAPLRIHLQYGQHRQHHGQPARRRHRGAQSVGDG